LWKSLILLAGLVNGHPRDVQRAQAVPEEVIADNRGA
jgi:hypothetical protein